jgi:hypothetical protein
MTRHVAKAGIGEGGGENVAGGRAGIGEGGSISVASGRARIGEGTNKAICVDGTDTVCHEVSL